MKIVHVVGARPNFMKVAPVWRAIDREIGCRQILIHTGQHYDVNMSELFFTDLALPEPDYYLGVGSGTHGVQTAAVMLAFEEVIMELKPDTVLVYGDVNSTLAAALVCAKQTISVAHVEAGLRSFDRSMPEEINRVLTDQIADLLFTPSEDGDQNLLREGIEPEKIHCVGNVMIDTLISLEGAIAKAKVEIPSAPYLLVTLHRPSNVDSEGKLKKIVATLAEISEEVTVLFPVHPRTADRISDAGSKLSQGENFQLLDPLGYIDFIALEKNAAGVITDSGGIQEETTYLGIPCLTVRENSERPVTVTVGTNTLVGSDMSLLKEEAGKILLGDGKTGKIPPLWDGEAAKRIAAILKEHQ
jgi:UDP-N-acetylglucosamine 2-epimerase (non-hydrolysing)